VHVLEVPDLETKVGVDRKLALVGNYAKIAKMYLDRPYLTLGNWLTAIYAPSHEK
jgi:hypothetical protein